MTLKSDPNFEEKLSFCLKNDMINLLNFKASSGKSENLHFQGLILSKVCYVWDKKNTGFTPNMDGWCSFLDTLAIALMYIFSLNLIHS